MRSFCVLVALSLFFVISHQTHFDGDKVIRFSPSGATHDLQFLKKLRSMPIDFWTETIVSTRPIDIRVPHNLIPELVTIFKQFNVKYEVIIEDVQKLVDDQKKQHVPVNELPSLLDESFYSSYHTYEEVISWTQQLVAANPNLTELITIGKSYEGRIQYAVKVSTNSSNGDKPALWFDGGIHAREWISTAAVVYMLGHIVSDHATDPDIKALLEEFDVYVLPLLNPDGYAYTWSSDRMWRKNRRPNSGSKCVGVDLNRNWDYHWGDSTDFSDTFPCSEAYRGPSAFSEVEVTNVADFLSKIPNLQGYINFHSYSQLWMFPWGYTTDPTPDYDLFSQQGNQVVKAIAQSYGTVYESGQISTIIYVAYGSSCDWIYGTLNTTFAIGVELRDTGDYGFLLPADQIVPSGVETLDGYIAYAKFISENNKRR